MPEKWNILYGSIDDVDTEIVSFPSGNSGEQLVSEMEPDISNFTQEDLAVLDYVISKLGDKTSNQLSELSHHEDAWMKFKDTSLLIDYTEAFTLKAL